MLYDPKWEAKTDPFTLEGLIAWLEQQPAKEAYEFCRWDNCLIAQWLRGIDPNAHRTPNGQDGFHYTVNGRVINTYRFKNIALGTGHKERQTFGGALERARAAL